MSFILHVACASVMAICLNAILTERQDQAQGPCSVQSKNQHYRAFQDSYEGENQDHAKALEAAKNYLACSVNADDSEDLLANLNLAVGQILNSNQSYDEAIPYFLNAASYNSAVKTSPQTYARLAEAYLEGPYAKQSAAYQVRFEGKDETDEGLLALENIFQLIDCIVDAYARAVALAGVELPEEPAKVELRGHMIIRSGPSGPTEWIEDLTVWYKFRHNNSAAGLKELIGTILSQPLPPQPVPITSRPQSKKVKTRRKR